MSFFFFFFSCFSVIYSSLWNFSCNYHLPI
jgi:hypothetical protein